MPIGLDGEVVPETVDSMVLVKTEPVLDRLLFVFGLQKTADAVSPSVGAGEVLFSLVAFTLIYAVLMAADIVLLRKYARAGVGGEIVAEPAPAGAR